MCDNSCNQWLVGKFPFPVGLQFYLELCNILNELAIWPTNCCDTVRHLISPQRILLFLVHLSTFPWNAWVLFTLTTPSGGKFQSMDKECFTESIVGFINGHLRFIIDNEETFTSSTPLHCFKYLFISVPVFITLLHCSWSLTWYLPRKTSLYF